ncbi:MAG: glutathione peroxidase, partial [Proteobacteria bacterium]
MGSKSVTASCSLVLALGALPLTSGFAAEASPKAAGAAACAPYLNQDLRKLHSSQSVNLCQGFGGKPMLVVNTASHCGFTPQFKGLEAVHQKFKDRGLAVVGFSSDDFNQEAKDEKEAADTCFLNYGVTFTMLAPQHVKGPGANAVFKELARQTSEPKWNFNKYLVSADGRTVQHFDSRSPHPSWTARSGSSAAIRSCASVRAS